MTSEAVAWIVLQAIREGLSLRDIMNDVRDSGEVSDDTWRDIENDIHRGNSMWDQG